MAKRKDKGSNGLLAEYECAYRFVKMMLAADFIMINDIFVLKRLRDEKVEYYSKFLTEIETTRAINQGIALAEEMFDSFAKNNGKNFVFTNYEFISKDHTFEIKNVGADTSRKGSEDLILEIQNRYDSSVFEIPISLKASASSSISMGSKSAVKNLIDCFGEIEGIQELKDEIKLFQTVAQECYNSVTGKKWMKEYGKKKEKPCTKISHISNPYRKEMVGNYFYEKKGYYSKQRLAELYVKLYKVGLNKLKEDWDWEMYNKAMIAATGFDNVITLSAIAKKNSLVVEEVIVSTESLGYAKVYKAFKNNPYFDLEYTGTGSIKVQMVDDDTIINSFTLQMWMDGTIQYKFNSKK